MSSEAAYRGHRRGCSKSHAKEFAGVSGRLSAYLASRCKSRLEIPVFRTYVLRQREGHFLAT